MVSQGNLSLVLEAFGTSTKWMLGLNHGLGRVMSDLITVLRSSTQRMCKVWLADGTIQQYDLAKWFDISQRDVADIHGLSALLLSLETDPHSCIIRGTPNSETDTTRSVRRLIDHFEDKPLHAVLVEIDDYRPVMNDPMSEPEEAALEYIAECLPAEFQNVSFHWQLSNSAGSEGKQHLLKAHLWFWLEQPYSSAILRAWAKHKDLELDRSVMQTVQVHYTATPLFEAGRVDPIAVRSGFVLGGRDDVPLDIDLSELHIRTQGPRQRAERVDGMEDPVADWICAHWETWGELANGGIIVSCPFEGDHTQARRDGDTSTVYFPAGTNGYPEGSWVCLHANCRDLTKSAFLCETGYTDAQLAQLAQTIPVDDGGMEIVDMSVLPPFFRKKSGKIAPTVNNLRMALERADLAGMVICKDTFKDEIVWSPTVDAVSWTPFNDTDYTELRLRLERDNFDPIDKGTIRDVVHHLAVERSFDTAIDWLSTLVWDGVPRMETFWIDHFGVPDDADGYARAVGNYTWTALAGRTMRPGIQADMVPILSGDQGIGKTRGLAAMSPHRDFATTMSFNEPEVERSRKMRGRLIVELAELQGLRSRDREEIKAWITRSDEHWTPKYMEMSTTFKRRCLFFGTTNDIDFLDDPSGERRWLPLAVGTRYGFEAVDVQGIEAVRDQLWAEGLARFNAQGIEWSAAQTLARGEHEQFKAEDAWKTSITRWLDTAGMDGKTPRETDFFTSTDVAQGALDIPAKSIRNGDQRRIGKVLRDAGLVATVKRVDGTLQRGWSMPV